MAANLIKVVKKGNDVLEVTGTVDGVLDEAGNLRVLVAHGWVSHMTNFYPPASYKADGTLTAGAVARAMTAAERQAYWRQLLNDAAAAFPVVQPADQLFP